MTDVPYVPQRRSTDRKPWTDNVRPFVSKEDLEVQALRAEIESLKLEVQSLSENLTQLMEAMYANLQAEVTKSYGRTPGIIPPV